MDMSDTCAVLVELSKLPCSVITVGVGDDDFDAMEVLDGDREKIPGCQRDIVQFVEFVKAIEKGDLAEQVLAEVPRQFMSYVEQNKIGVQYTKQQ